MDKFSDDGTYLSPAVVPPMRWRTCCSRCPGPASPESCCLRIGREPTPITSVRALNVRPQQPWGCWRLYRPETGRQWSNVWCGVLIIWYCVIPNQSFLICHPPFQLRSSSRNQRRCMFPRCRFLSSSSEAAAGSTRTSAVSGISTHRSHYNNGKLY